MEKKWNELRPEVKKLILLYSLSLVLSVILLGVITYGNSTTFNIQIVFSMYIVMLITCLVIFYYGKLCLETEEINKIQKIDTLPTEILIAGAAITLYSCFYLIQNTWIHIMNAWSLSNLQTSILIAFLGFHFLCFFYVILYLLLRKQKKKNLWKESISKVIYDKGLNKYKKYKNQFSFIRQIFLQKIIFICIMAIGFLLVLMLALFAFNKLIYIDTIEFLRFIILICLLEGIAAIWYIKSNTTYEELQKLMEFIEQINEGELSTNITYKEDSPFYQTAVKLSDISGNIKRTLDKQLKDKEIKENLMINMSSHLQTQLIEISQYLDLLKEENSTSQAKDYIKVLSNRTTDLKKIVQDFSELTNSTNGIAKVKLEKIDIEKLLLQTLESMGNQILKSKKVIKKNFSENLLCLIGDYNILNRVYQILIENALKYSLEGTRIYLDVEKEGKEVIITIKNTASYEMNFTKDTISEQADIKDTKLGLVIAKSFIENCGGSLDIIIDGDLFKVITRFSAV